jgi:hypothetical protein
MYLCCQALLSCPYFPYHPINIYFQQLPAWQPLNPGSVKAPLIITVTKRPRYVESSVLVLQPFDLQQLCSGSCNVLAADSTPEVLRHHLIFLLCLIFTFSYFFFHHHQNTGWLLARAISFEARKRPFPVLLV